MPDVFVKLREGGEEGGVPVPADGVVRLTPVSVPDSEAWVTSAPTVLTVVGGSAEPAEVSPGRWRVDAYSTSWARTWTLDLVDSGVPVNLAALTPVDPVTPLPWVPTEADLAYIRATVDGLPSTIRAIVDEGDYTGPEGRGIESIADPDGDGTATVTYTDGTTEVLPLPPGRPGDDGETPTVEWDGPVLVVDGERSPDLTGPPGEGGGSNLIGPGRPDVPSTTGGLVNASTPVGTTYTSTDGAGVGAYGWRKRPSGAWEVIDGDTGLRNINGLLTGLLEPLSPYDAGTFIRRDGPWVTVDVKASLVAYGNSQKVATGFNPPTAVVDSFFPIRSVATAAQIQFTAGGTLQLIDAGATEGTRVAGTAIYMTTEPWPTALPGTPG